jgi:hypothetical protein
VKIHSAFALIAFTASVASVCDAGIEREIRFTGGSNSATVEGAVIRGERDLYYLTAKTGQTMEVNISALQDNAVFAIFKPGATATVKNGFTEIKGEAVPKASETEDATAWKGTLPASGKYLIVVGGTRGNATYKLKVTIR